MCVSQGPQFAKLVRSQLQRLGVIVDISISNEVCESTSKYRSLACNPLFLNHVYFGCVSCFGDGISIFDHLFLRVDPVNMATVTVNECTRQKKSPHTHIARRCKKVRYSAGFETGIRVLMFSYF